MAERDQKNLGEEIQGDEKPESVRIAEDTSWMDRVNQKIRDDQVLNALFIRGLREPEEETLEKLKEFEYEIEFIEDLRNIVQEAVLIALKKEIAKEDVLNVSSIFLAMKNEEDLDLLKEELENALRKTVPAPSHSQEEIQIALDQNKRLAIIEQSLESIKNILGRTVSLEEKQEYVKKLFEMAIGMEKPQFYQESTPQAPVETKAEKPTVETVVKMLTKDRSLQTLIHGLEGLRLTLSNREEILDFGFIPEGFESAQQFEDVVNSMVRANDPILFAESIEDLLAAHMKLSIEANPDFLEAWDPNSSPEMMRGYFGNLWKRYLKTNKPKFYG